MKSDAPSNRHQHIFTSFILLIKQKVNLKFHSHVHFSPSHLLGLISNYFSSFFFLIVCTRKRFSLNSPEGVKKKKSSKFSNFHLSEKISHFYWILIGNNKTSLCNKRTISRLDLWGIRASLIRRNQAKFSHRSVVEKAASSYRRKFEIEKQERRKRAKSLSLPSSATIIMTKEKKTWEFYHENYFIVSSARWSVVSRRKLNFLDEQKTCKVEKLFDLLMNNCSSNCWNMKHWKWIYFYT